MTNSLPLRRKDPVHRSRYKTEARYTRVLSIIFRHLRAHVAA